MEENHARTTAGRIQAGSPRCLCRDKNESVLAAEVKPAGAEYAEISIDGAVVDGNLVTAPAQPAHRNWLGEFLKVLGTKIVP
jgi:putative intracellular protease/amidase